MNQADTIDDLYGVLTEPATLKIQRLLPGPIERVWSYLTKEELRRQWFASGEMEMKVGAPFELVWRNDELTSPPGERPEGFSAEHRMKTEISELDPPHRLSYVWPGAGEVTFLLETRGTDVMLTVIHSRHSEPPDAGWRQRRMARPSRPSGAPDCRREVPALLGRTGAHPQSLRPAHSRRRNLNRRSPHTNDRR